MSKVSVTNFDSDVCMGDRADVDGPCPRRVPIDEDTGRRVIDGLARIEGRALNAVRGGDAQDESDFKCGCCGCPLVNLELANVAPEDCPRLESHNK